MQAYKMESVVDHKIIRYYLRIGRKSSRLDARCGHVREASHETLEKVVKLLKAGKSPKEIADRLRLSWSAIKLMIHRHQTVKKIFVDTYPLRYPATDDRSRTWKSNRQDNTATPPPKILLRQIQM